MTRKFTFMILAMLFAILGPGAKAWGQNYQLVTSTSDLVAGCKYLIGNSTSGEDVKFMSTESNANNRKVTSGTVSNDGIVSLTNEMLVLELGGSTGEWTLKTTNYQGTNGYLASAASGKNNYCRVISDKTTATISFSANNVANITLQPHTERNKLKYNANSGSPLFACYSSGQSDIYLYKESTSPTVAAPTFNPAGGEYVEEQTVTISTETEDATIYYNFTGEEPWTKYTTPVTISQTSTLYAYATKTDCEDSEIASAAYTISSTITLNAPTLTITAGNAKVTPTWAAVEHATSYTLEYATESAFASPATITSAVSGTDITGLTNETTYYFRIKAIGDETYLTSGWSATVSATPSAVVTMSIDFESESSTYTDWTFSNMTSKQSNITAHGGSYIGTTGGKETASITTKYKIINPLTFTCYVSKASNNTTSSNWKVQISSDGSSWTDVKTQSATSMSQGEWVEISQDLSVYHNVYVRIYYTGSSAIRTIDDLTLTYAPAEYYAITIDENIQNGTVEADKETATVGEIVTLTAEPNSSFILGEWNVTYIDGESQTQNITVTDNTFTMPAFPVTVSATFVERPAAAFTDGVYTESFASDFGQWITYNEIGDQVWNISNGYAHINGYSGGAKDNIDWLISPKMTAENAKLIVNFISKLNYSNQNSSLVMKYSTNYNGTGEPTTATWNELSPTIATSSTDTNSGDIEIEAASCYVAFIYTSTSAGAGEYFIKNFNAKQCYTVTYNANNGSGEMTDTNSPYTVGAEVTTLKNTFTAPAATPNFAGWNTKADGTGYSYNEEANFNMPAENVILYAQWTATVVYTITVEASEYGTVESDKATAEADETVTLTVTPNEHYQLQSITATSGEGENVYITNEYTFVMPDNNVTITATFEPIMYTVSFSVNDNTEILASTSVQEGSAIGTLPTPGDEYIPTGFDFAGWSSSESSTATIGETYIVDADVTLYAIFSREVPSPSTEEAVTIIDGSKLTSTATTAESQLTIDGKNIVLSKGAKQQASTGDNRFSDEAILIGKEGAYIYNTTPFDDISKFEIYANKGASAKVSVGINFSTSAISSYSETADNTWTATLSTLDNVYDASAKLPIGAKYFWYQVTNANNSQVQFRITYQKPTTTTEYYIRVFEESEIEDLTVEAPMIIMGGYTLTVANDLTIANNSAALTIEKDAIVIIEGTLTNNGTCDNLVIEDGGQLIVNNKDVQATMKKEITGSTPSKASNVNWYTISSPLAADETEFANVTNLIPSSGVTGTDYDLYRLDEKSGVWVNSRLENGANPAFTTIDKGVGYIYHNNANTELEFAGEINVASVNRELTNGAAHGFNLIGNPFAQNITLNNVTGVGLAEGFYVLTNQNTWGTEPMKGEIKPLQGFLVQAKTAGNVTISKPAAKSKGERSNEQSTNIEMIVSNASFKDNAYAMFGEGTGLNKVSHRNAEAPMLYIPQDGEDFAIAFMDENTTVFPLSFKAMTTGSYSISLKATDDVSTLVLVDNMTGVETNMLLEDSYTFIGSPADNENRFTVKLTISHNDGQSDSEHFAYQNGNELVVNGEGTLQIFDILGRVVVSEEVHGQTVNVGGLNTGAYIVRLTGESVMTQKIVVR